MKNIVSLLAVALFATVFAAGCGKFKECKDATKSADCVKEKFEDGKFNCEWKADKCVAVKKDEEPKPPVPVDADAADKALCAAAKADATACTAASATLAKKATHECKFSGDANANPPTNACKFDVK
jgi:hypothetical protein